MFDSILDDFMSANSKVKGEKVTKDLNTHTHTHTHTHRERESE